MAAKATDMSCTAVTITTGMSGYFSLVRSNRPIPSRSAIIRSESISSNSSPEVSTASASMPEPACLHTYPEAVSIDATISRMASSSSTTKMRSGMGLHRSLSAIVTHRADAESNQNGPETPLKKPLPMIFRHEEYVRSEHDERFPLVSFQRGFRGPGPAPERRRMGAGGAFAGHGGHPGGRAGNILPCLDRGLDRAGRLAFGRARPRAWNSGAV